jgi:hypothetical protein
MFIFLTIGLGFIFFKKIITFLPFLLSSFSSFQQVQSPWIVEEENVC